MRITRTAYLLSCLIAGILMPWSVDHSAADPGPLAAQNRFPFHLLFLNPRPVPAHLPDQGAVRANAALEYSSVYFDQRSTRWDVLMDMEMTVVDLSVTYGLTPRLALRLDVPLVSMNSGFLDGFLESYHDALGVGNYGRENRPRDTFAYEVRKDDRLWLEGESGGFRWSDIALSAQWALLQGAGDGRWTGALMGSVKLPTGSAGRGYGSGAWDAGLFLPLQWASGPLTVYMMPGFIWHGAPDTAGADVSARNSCSMFLGAAYDYGPRWRWLAQLNYFTSPLEKTGIERLDDGALELALGFQRMIDAYRYVEFAFCEDPFTLAAPDFNIRLAVVWRMGR